MKFLIRPLVVLILLLPSFSSADELVLTTGPIGSDSWEIGSYISSIFEDAGKNTGISINVVPSRDYLQNIKRLSSGAVNMAIVDALSLYRAEAGKEGPENRHGRKIYNLSVIGIEVEHFVLFSNLSDKEDIFDLSEKTLYLGQNGDIQKYGAVTITDCLGLATSTDGGGELDTETAVELMIDGVFDGGIFSGVPPVSHLVRLRNLMGKNASFLEVPEEIYHTIRETCPIWFRYTISPGTYPDQKEPIKTIARPIFLLTTDLVDNRTARAIVEVIFDGKDKFSSPFAPIPITIDMNIEHATTALHPGAASYYEKMGFTVSTEGDRK